MISADLIHWTSGIRKKFPSLPGKRRPAVCVSPGLLYPWDPFALSQGPDVWRGTERIFNCTPQDFLIYYASHDAAKDRSVDAMIKITVFGATGRTGRAVISLALTQGMEVTAYARKAEALQELAGRITILEGGLDDADRIAGAIDHADAVVIAFGPRKGGPQVFCAHATQLIVSAMKEKRVRRLVCVTGALVGEQYPSRGLFYRAMRRMLVRKAPHLMLDRDGQETIVMNSGLDWTVFKPPRLMNGADRPGTQLGPDLVIGPAARTTVGSLATAILGELLGSQLVRKAVFIRS